MPDTLSIIAWNAHGWPTVYDEPYVQQLFGSFDIIFISETWTNQHTIETTLCPPTYKVLTSNYPPAPGPTHCGIALYYKATLPISVITHQSTSWKPIIWIQIQTHVLGFAYLPPTNSNYLAHWMEEPLELLLEQAEQHQQHHPRSHITIMGDLNARLPTQGGGGNERGKILQNTLNESWYMHKEGPTHYSLGTLATSCIDYILQNESAKNMQIAAETLPFTDLSDHAPLALYVRLAENLPIEIQQLPHTKPPPITMGPLEIREKALTAGTLPLPRQKAFVFKPDTTAINQARHRLQAAIHAYQQNHSPHLHQEYKRARNQIRMEQKKLQSQRLHAEQEY